MTTTPETPDKPVYVSEPLSRVLERLFIWSVQAFVVLVICVATVAAAFYGYQWLEQSGYIHHDRTLDVYMTSNWLVGENRICWLVLQTGANGSPTGKLEGLRCPVGFETLEPHNVTVTFDGVVNPVDTFGNRQTVADQWSCKRGNDEFTCDPMATPTNPTN